MRQNIGLLFYTVGSIILSVRVFWGKIVSSWEGLPYEQRMFYKLTAGKTFYQSFQKDSEYKARLLSDKESDKRFVKHQEIRNRIITDLPILQEGRECSIDEDLKQRGGGRNRYLIMI